MVHRLRQLRLDRSWTHDQAANAMRVSRGQFIKLERGERKLTERTIALAAKAFGVSEAEILVERGTVPVVGFVGAGDEAHFYREAQGPFDEAPAVQDSNDNTVAVEIRGDSLGPVFNHALAYFDEVRKPVTTDLIGKLCVVGLADGRILIKKITRSKTSPKLFHLAGQHGDPILDTPVEWAAKVKTIVPR
jgi:transcriptional regulator with XRE-family HTH domain